MTEPLSGYTSGDLDRLSGLPGHAEIIDGHLALPGRRSRFHTVSLYVLEKGLRRSAPSELRVRREMTVTLGPKQRPEPDVLVIDAAIETDPTGSETSYPPHAVRLVCEVVSPESEERDRKRKPQLYAEAGIPHFWRVEHGADGPAVYTYELDRATSSYHLTGIHHGRLTTGVPYSVDIDLAEGSRIRRGWAVGSGAGDSFEDSGLGLFDQVGELIGAHLDSLAEVVGDDHALLGLGFGVDPQLWTPAVALTAEGRYLHETRRRGL